MVGMMEIQAGFKQTEVGVIPSDWEVTKLKSIVSKIVDNRGKTPPYSKNEVIELIETVSISFVNQHPDYSKVTKYVSKYTFENWFRDHPKKEDILVSTVGEYSGSTALMNETRGTVAQNLIAVRVKNVVSAYIFHWTRSSCYKKQLDQVMMSHAQPSLRVPWLLNFQIPLSPTKAEQTAIATALNDADALITQLEKLIAKKRAIKQGAMQYILTGIKRLNGFAEEWIEKPFTNVCNLIHGHQFRTNDFIEGSDGIKVIKIGNVQDGGFDTKECDCINPDRFDEFRAYLITNGDILMSLTGNIGRVVRVKDIREPILQNYRVGKFVPNGVDAAFLAYALSSMQTTKQLEMLSNQTSQANFGKQDFEKVKIKLPRTVDEQKVIAKILIDIDFEIEAIENQVEKYKMLKQGMMQKLLTGKIRLI